MLVVKLIPDLHPPLLIVLSLYKLVQLILLLHLAYFLPLYIVALVVI